MRRISKECDLNEAPTPSRGVMGLTATAGSLSKLLQFPLLQSIPLPSRVREWRREWRHEWRREWRRELRREWRREWRCIQVI